MPARKLKALYEDAQFLHQFGRDLERVSDRQDISRVIRFALRRLGEFLKADMVVQMDVRRNDRTLDRPFILTLSPQGERLIARAQEPAFVEPFRAFLRRPLGPEDHTLMLLRVTSVDRPEAVLGFLRPGRQFSRAETALGQGAVEILSENLRHRERERAQALKERIYAKILCQIRPKDVLYQILHGLERLLRYDHGSTILLLSPEGHDLIVQAEIIGWTKAKSERIGRSHLLTDELRRWIEHLVHPVLFREGEDDSSRTIPEPLKRLLLETEPAAPAVRSLLVAALRHRDRPLGVLTLRARSAVTFTPADLRTLDEFLPLASVTLYNSTLYEAQHDKLVTAERKTALADLARAISHDLNNAFGVMLPLLQTVRRDLDVGVFDREKFTRDLEVIEHYARSSSRIFQGLLSMARGAAEPADWTDLCGIIDAIVGMIGPSLEGKKILVRTEATGPLPKIFLRRSDMEQLFLNLVYNARDAMPRGGTLTLRCTPAEDGVLVEVQDSGIGMTEDVKRRMFEPFFTTKKTGTGLGLDICRSIVWDYDGKMEIDSSPGIGTRVIIWLPRLAERLRDELEGRIDEC